VALLDRQLESMLGCSPRADILLENAVSKSRIWIELEISRADPAANHMKFAVGHLFLPQAPGDTFVSMVSNHVAPGRANLGAGAVLLMRRLGMHAFQIPLFPRLRGAEIKSLNHLSPADLAGRNLDVRAEIDRAIAIVEPAFGQPSRPIFFASNSFEVALNVIGWNREIAICDRARLWGKRTLTYFVYDPRSSLFAPSKFCAFLPVPDVADPGRVESASAWAAMTIDYYCALDEQEPRFDGGVARRHFLERLGYRLIPPGECCELQARFRSWSMAHAETVQIHPRGAHLLIPDHLGIC
jgi:hypothetical protein